MTEFMITLRKADGSNGVGSPRFLTFDDPGGPEQTYTSGQWVRTLVGTFPTTAPSRAGDGPSRVGDILFLVHGFNVNHAAAKAFHVQCATALAAAGWNGQVVSYDWPSDGLVFAYLDDRSNARAAASALVTSGISLLQAAQQKNCTIDVHVISHSMGGFVVQQAFTWAYQDVPSDWHIGQLIFVAADVDSSVFSAGTVSTNSFAAHAGRLSAYCNKYDKALLASNAKRLDLAPRMGRVGLPQNAPSFMCEIECSAVFDKVFPNDLPDELSPVTTHCFYFDQDEFWRDVVLTLAGGIDRSVIPTRFPDPDTSTPNRFILNPDGITLANYRAALARSAVSPSIKPPAGP